MSESGSLNERGCMSERGTGPRGRHRIGQCERDAPPPAPASPHGAGCRVQDAGCRVQGAGCRVQGAGCHRVQGKPAPEVCPLPTHQEHAPEDQCGLSRSLVWDLGVRIQG